MKLAKVLAFAKINLSLAVLNRRADGFHEIRTVFHTISVADRLTIGFARGRKTSVETGSSVEIPGENIATRAAQAILDELRICGGVRITIDKRIPMGGGLGGGSTDAAAVLKTLPALVGRPIPDARLREIAAGLGSDVPFLLRGGCALGIGRGEELYPLPSPPARHGLLVTPPVHVSTRDAYAALGRPSVTAAEGVTGAAEGRLGVTELTSKGRFPILDKLQSLAWTLQLRPPGESWSSSCVNDFEEVVFRQYPVLKEIRRKLEQAGAAPARMTGSGAALFGFFPDAAAAQAASRKLRGVPSLPFILLGIRPFQSRWNRWLSPFRRT
jgi:4-diphosphocytidyl-2-C-methyl-D-erythritol kinase